jgi:MoxR-like ATPase
MGMVNPQNEFTLQEGGKASFKSKYLSFMPIMSNGSEMTCDELNTELQKRGVILDKVQQIMPMCSALKTGKNLMFDGPPGTGKTLTANKLGDILFPHFPRRNSKGQIEKTGLYRVSAHRDMNAADLFGDWKLHQQMLEAQQCNTQPTASCGAKDFFTFEYFNSGPALKAVQEGGILFIDEINRAGPDFPNLIFEVAEEKQITIPSLNNGNPIWNEKDKRFPLIIGTMNEVDTGTTREMSTALARRFAYIQFTNPDGDTLRRVVSENYGPSIEVDGSRVATRALNRIDEELKKEAGK